MYRPQMFYSHNYIRQIFNAIVTYWCLTYMNIAYGCQEAIIVGVSGYS